MSENPPEAEKPKKRRKPKNDVGRPPFFRDEEKFKAFCDGLEAGNTVTDAAAQADIDPSTAHRCMQKAREPDAPQEYRDFRHAVRQARRRARARCLTLIANFAMDDWEAAKWLYTLLAPERSSPKVTVIVREEQRQFLERLRTGLPPDLFRRVLDVAVSGGGAPRLVEGTATRGGEEEVDG